MSKPKTIDTMKVMRFMFRESFKEKQLWLSVIFMPVSTLGLRTAVPFLISAVLADLATQTEQNWLLRIGIIAAVALVAIIANRTAFMSLLMSQARSTERIQNDILHSLMHKSASFYANRMTGKLVSDGIGLSNAFIKFQDVIAINLFPFFLALITGIIIVSVNSLLLGLGLLVLSATVVGTAVYNSKRRAPLRYKRHETRRMLHGYFADLIINNQAIKTFAREDYEEKEHGYLNSEFTKIRLHDWRLITTDGNNRILMVTILQLIFIGIIIQQVTNNPALLATGIFAFSFTITLSNRMFEVSTLIRGLEESTTDAYPMIKVLEEDPEVKDVPEAKALRATHGEIELENVLFKYSDQNVKDHLFKELNLHIKPGEKIGLVGRSGGGKSTLTKLLLRFIDIQDGKILIDGQNIAEVTQQSLRRNIAYVPQEPLLFHRSLAENIAYGKPKATKGDIEKVAKMAHAHEFIKDLPDSYDTLVGERGVKLSGGQRQRIAIARAMLKDAPILLLDEATSALDSESEVLIQDALWKLMEGRTAIVIAHRLSTIQKMDRILVMEDGKIVEQGSHKKLVKAKGVYADLWNHQTGGFIEE